MDEYLDIRGMFTWIFDCFVVTLGPVDETVLRQLEANHYDQAPVKNPETGQVIGVIDTRRLRALSEADIPLVGDEPAIKLQTSLVTVELENFLSQIESDRSVLITRNSGEVVGLFTVSDLNSHRFRAAIYPYLARLESDLADAVDLEFDDPWQWLKWLGDGAIGIVGHWEVLKRNGMDLSATSGASLTQLLQVIENHEPLFRLIGFESKTKLGQFRRKIGPIRNAVMHPSRPLIDHEDRVASLREVLSLAMSACGRLDGRLGEARRADGMCGSCGGQCERLTALDSKPANCIGKQRGRG